MVHVNDPDGFPAASVANSNRQKERSTGSEVPETSLGLLTEKQVSDAVEKAVHFLRQQRAHFYPLGQSLDAKTKTFLARFFDPSLLGQVKVVKMTGERVANPPFLETAKQMGFKNLPDLKHQATVTFLDVVVFNEEFTERALFHGLVHATQVQVLGIERFAELFLRGFLRMRSYFMVPLKAHAFSLDCQFAEHRERGFSVETEVSRWLEQGRY